MILKSASDHITLTYVAATGTLAGNDLQGSATSITTPANTYMLTKGASGVGFYHWTGENIPAGRAYIALSASAREMLPFTDSTETGIETAEHLTVTAADNCYDLYGRRIMGTPAVKGIYLKNGKKMMIK